MRLSVSISAVAITVSDHPDKIDADKEARLAQLVFYLGYEIAQATERPKWNPDSYREIVQQTR